MIFTYFAIFREANRQEKQLAARQGNAMLMHRHSSAGGTNGTYGKATNKICYSNQCKIHKQLKISFCCANVVVLRCVCLTER